MVKNTSNYVRILTEKFPYYSENFSIKYIGIFGSVSRNEHNMNSDIDLLVHFIDTPSVFTLISLEDYFSQYIDLKIDILVENNMKNCHEICSDVIKISHENS